MRTVTLKNTSSKVVKPTSVVSKTSIGSPVKTSPKVLAFTTSKGRPHQLAFCITQMQNQTFPVDHAIFINHPDAISSADQTNYSGLALEYCKVPKGMVVVAYGKSGGQHENYTTAVKLVDRSYYDLFIKIDDDDFYLPGYVASVVADWKRNKWDFSGTHSDGLVKGEQWVKTKLLHSLGESAEDKGAIKVMPPTFAFSRRAIDKIVDLPEITTAWEDQHWRRMMDKDKTLRTHERTESSFIYNIHGSNISRTQPRKEAEAVPLIIPDFHRNYMSGYRWQSVVVTAPRKNQTLAASLKSLHHAGFSPLIFAEPGSEIPDNVEASRVYLNSSKMGVLANSYNAIKTALEVNKTANIIAYFQDDISLMSGAREWMESQLWPDHVPVVSLYTAANCLGDKTGWSIVKNGYYRTFGALGILFRRDAAEDYVNNAKIQKTIVSGKKDGDDACIGQWALERGHGIAYHTPSIISHTGSTSTLGHDISGPNVDVTHPVSPDKMTSEKSPSSMVLVGWNTAQGIGYINRGIAKHLNPETWIIPKHPTFSELPDTNGHQNVLRCSVDEDADIVGEMVKGKSWALFVELPFIRNFAGIARNHGVQVACIPMWEWLHEKLDWIKYVDVFLCPTKYTYDMLTDWKRKMGAAWRVEYTPCPVDTDELKFVQRGVCRQFLFNNGNGGGSARMGFNTRSGPRKGLDIVIAAAKRVPDIEILIRTQNKNIPQLPDNVTLIDEVESYTELYGVGDVAVQPSRYEGVGLQALESQACGLPLISTNHAPMNEFNLIGKVKGRIFNGSVYGDRVIQCVEPSPESLADEMRKVYDKDISRHSLAARKFIEDNHSWDVVGPKIRSILGLSSGA